LRECVDGFTEAYCGRPEMFLDPATCTANSAWTFVPDDAARTGIERLRTDPDNGGWDQNHNALRTQPHFDGSLVS
jgi:hypothetical protein